MNATDMKTFANLVEATASVASSSPLMYGTAPSKDDELMTLGAPYMCLRAFLRDAADESAVADIYGWLGQERKGVLLSRIKFIAGAESVTEHPFGGSPDTFYEADHIRWQKGLVRPARIVRGVADTPANGAQYLIYLPTVGALSVTAECQDIDTAAKLLIGGQPSYVLPDAPIASVPISATGAGTIDGVGGRSFTFAGDQSEIVIVNRTAGIFYVKLGSTTAGATDWNLPALGPNETLRITKPHYLLAIYSTVAATQGTDYDVLGWE